MAFLRGVASHASTQEVSLAPGQGFLTKFRGFLSRRVLADLSAVTHQIAGELVDAISKLSGPTGEFIELGGIDFPGSRSDLLIHRRQTSRQLPDAVDDLPRAIGVGRHPAGQPVGPLAELLALVRQGCEPSGELGDTVGELAAVS